MLGFLSLVEKKLKDKKILRTRPTSTFLVPALSIIFAWLKKQRGHPTTCFSSLFVVNFRDRLECWEVLNKIEELYFDCSPQRNTILLVNFISKENGDLKGTQKFDGKQPNNRLEQVKFFSVAVLLTNLVTNLTFSRGISH